MKLMMLGAGKLQLNAIIKAQEMGIEVVAVDYYTDSPGKSIADYKGFASTFDVEACMKLAIENKIDGIMTVGTDQPVYTAAVIAEQLKLPFYISSETAYNVTNKKAMKELFKKNQIPTVEWFLLNSEEKLKNSKLTFPLVIKPVDSQGQRGVFLVYSLDELLEKRPLVFEYTRDSQILVEAYYPNKEITVSGWVKDGETYPITITDRVTFENEDKLGICVSHEYPTVHLEKYRDEIFDLTKKIVKVFKINNGPIYFQMLVGKEGIKVNEIACRIGGAYEDIWIKKLTDIDLLKMNIQYCMGFNTPCCDLYKWEYPRDLLNTECMSIQLFFANKGYIFRQTQYETLLGLPGVLYVDYNYYKGSKIEEISNASQRAGVFIVTGSNEKQISDRVDKVFTEMKFESKDGSNLIIRGKRGNRHETE